jgi:alpha-amylase/alpha-mannosidase (GH57 family)
MANRFLCIHGHFYQPPRENPWLEAIERQLTADPYHDWNARVTRECYGPNARARIVDGQGRILKLLSNYAHMSFNFGPTLLIWMKSAEPWIYEKILASDAAGAKRNLGHGNALAQVYNHVIMPLANRRDKLTQIRWGLADFKHRFGRPAEGLWLAETAVNLETLSLMADEGVKFTVLSPEQARRVRALPDRAGKAGPREKWQDVVGGRVDPSRPYRVFFSERRRRFLDVFFYDQPVSRGVAFEGLTSSGEKFLSRVEGVLGRDGQTAQLLSVATDGESYGHHAKFGEMALAWMFDRIQVQGNIELINYACYLERFPPTFEAEVIENSSWSCAHGVERWVADCGCATSPRPGWNQKWREPLRQGLDWLAGELAALFEREGGRLFSDPWQARDAYIDVLLDPSPETREAFLHHQARSPLGRADQETAFRLLESQRMSMFMFTSCGWFFDDIAGLEPIQNMKYAARAMELVSPWAGRDLAVGLLAFLEKAKSNEARHGTGADIYRREVGLSRLDANRAAANRGFLSLFEAEGNGGPLSFGHVHPLSRHRLTGAEFEAEAAEWRVDDLSTGGSSYRTSLAAHGLPGLSCRVAEGVSRPGFVSLVEEFGKTPPTTWEGFFRDRMADFSPFTLDDALADTQFSVLEARSRELSDRIDAVIAPHLADYQELVASYEAMKAPLPDMLHDLTCLLADHELGVFLDDMLAGRKADWDLLDCLRPQGSELRPRRQTPMLQKKAARLLETLIARLAQGYDADLLRKIVRFLDVIRDLSLEIDLWVSQNLFEALTQDPGFCQGLPDERWTDILGLGRRLNFASQEETYA